MKPNAIPSLFEWNSFQLPKRRKSPVKRSQLEPVTMQVIDANDIIEEGTYDIPVEENFDAQGQIISLENVSE